MSEAALDDILEIFNMLNNLKTISEDLKKFNIKKWSKRNQNYSKVYLKEEIRKIIILISG